MSLASLHFPVWRRGCQPAEKNGVLVPTHAIKELGCVALAADLPEHGLAAGDVGAVVHAYEGGRSYPVEFTTYDGRTVAAAKVSAAQIHPIGSKEIHHARAFEPAVC